MMARDYWQMFLETGAPEIYLLYNHVRRMETNDHVPDDAGAGAAGNSLQ